MKQLSPVSDPVDAALLTRLQEAIPCLNRPFENIGNSLGLPESEVIDRLRKLKSEKIIRQISAIFDTRSLGYASSLVAAKVDPGKVDEAAAVINQHPGVSHNYLRNHEYNLWFTIAVAPTSRFGLEGTVQRLHELSGAEATRLLPTLRLFKIGVRFDMGSESRPDEAAAGEYFSEEKRSESKPLTEQEIEFVRVMQRDLPLQPQPFSVWAQELGMDFSELRQMHEEFLSSGRMRRFAAVLHHRQAGFRANAMGVWAGPSDPIKLEEAGRAMAGFKAVSHCYQRPSYPDWPYNLFTMVHGRSVEECEESLAAISAATGLRNYQALYSSKEYKKVRVRYFTTEEAEWEEGQSRVSV